MSKRPIRKRRSLGSLFVRHEMALDWGATQVVMDAVGEGFVPAEMAIGRPFVNEATNAKSPATSEEMTGRE